MFVYPEMSEKKKKTENHINKQRDPWKPKQTNKHKFHFTVASEYSALACAKFNTVVRTYQDMMVFILVFVYFR